MSDSDELNAILQSLMHPDLKAIDLSLDRMYQLLDAMGNPQQSVPPVIHVAGTNGKGSTIAFMRSILEAAGYSVHAYTSPHLVHFRERFVVAGKEISDEILLPKLKALQTLTQSYPATFFESTTALAFELFAETPADFTLLEVGLGGRLDATNVVEKPIACAITSIGMDHMEYLGDSIEQIAAEKAAIMKTDVPVYVSYQDQTVLDVMQQTADQKHALLEVVKPLDESYELGLAGDHQRYNAALAVAIARKLRMQGYSISDAHITKGLMNVRWLARLMPIERSPLADLMPDNTYLWLDGGHNVDASEALAQWMGTLDGDVHLICGMVARKSAYDYLKPISQCISQCVAVNIDNEADTMPKQDILDAANDLDIAAGTADSLEEAVLACLQRFKVPKNHIIIGGSLYLAGNVLENNG